MVICLMATVVVAMRQITTDARSVGPELIFGKVHREVAEPRRQEAEFIMNQPENRFLTGAALLPNTLPN